MDARVLLAGLALLSSPALAGETATATGTVGVSIVDPISVREIDPLRFGVIAAANGRSGTITVDPQTGASQFGGGLAPACPASTSCFAQPGVFAVKGEARRFYRISVPSTAAAQHEPGTGAPLSLDLISVWSNAGNTGGPRGLLGEDGNDSFRVGGRLNVPAGASPGVYRAEIAVVVSYD